MMTLFEALWPTLEKGIEAIPSDPTPVKHARPQAEVLEELVASVRNLDARYRDDWDGPQFRGRRSHRRMMMLEEFMNRAHMEKGDLTTLLFAGSFFKDDFPWIQELTFELYRNLREKDLAAANRTYKSLRRSLSMLRHAPFMDDFDSKPTYIISRELERLPLRWLEREPPEDEPNSDDAQTSPKPRIRKVPKPR